jgi:hypothetical protein
MIIIKTLGLPYILPCLKTKLMDCYLNVIDRFNRVIYLRVMEQRS